MCRSWKIWTQAKCPPQTSIVHPSQSIQQQNQVISDIKETRCLSPKQTSTYVLILTCVPIRPLAAFSSQLSVSCCSNTWWGLLGSVYSYLIFATYPSHYPLPELPLYSTHIFHDWLTMCTRDSKHANDSIKIKNKKIAFLNQLYKSRVYLWAILVKMMIFLRNAFKEN